MAQQQNTSSENINTVGKGLIKDLNESYVPEGTWYHAKNATPISSIGDLETLGNEPSNLKCNLSTSGLVPYTIIGIVHMTGDQWIVFSTDNTNSEVGIFDDSDCSYRPVITPKFNSINGVPAIDTSCLNLKKEFLIKGISKQNFDCSYSVYWADGLNFDRVLNLSNPPLKCVNAPVNPADPSCFTCVPIGRGIPSDPYILDCELLRIASIVITPCITVTQGTAGGNLPNGSYFATIAYVVNGQVVTDYSVPSVVQPLFSHDNLAGSLEINLDQIDTDHFDEFQLVIVSTVNQQTVAKAIGIYSTKSKTIFIDNIPTTLPSVPIELIPIRTPHFEKSEGIYEIGSYAVRVGPTENFDFNYQPLANGITAKWSVVEYPEDYYKKGGNKTSYLRDEVYTFYIRWIYNTGDKSSSYHIPGRPPKASDLTIASSIDVLYKNNVPSCNISSARNKNWQVYNTATLTSSATSTICDGGLEVAEGDMGYWESTEIYPNDKPQVWNASGQSWPDHIPGQLIVDLCGKAIRHHKMPDQSLGPLLDHFVQKADGVKYRLLAVKFDNIRAPLYNDGTPITNIVGYEILRGSREGNKTIIAKGMINNTRNYKLTAGGSTRQGVYPNYPYNPTGDDPTIVTQDPSTKGGWAAGPLPLSTGVNANVYTFHSPDTQFKSPFLSTKELKLYGEISGEVIGSFSEVPDHPKEKLLGDLAFVVAALVGIASASLAVRGQRTRTFQAPAKFATAFTGPAGADPSNISAPIALATYAGTASTASLLSMTLANIAAAAVAPGNDPTDTTIKNAGVVAGSLPGITEGFLTESKQLSELDYMPPAIKVFAGVMVFSHYWMLGTDVALRLIEALVPYRQYAYRYLSHGLYDNFNKGNAIPNGGFRRLLKNANYLEPQIQDFGANYKVNNLYRGRAIVLETDTIKNTITLDNTVTKIGSGTPGANISTTAASHYGALKVELEAQYGQMGATSEIPITCPFSAPPFPTITDSTPFTNTDIIFGGDTYIGRYTEKNTFFYFYDWLYKQPDGYEFDYRLRYMVNYPNFWADFTKFEAGEFLQGIGAAITSPGSGLLSTALPSGKARLDNGANPVSSFFSLVTFGIKKAYFYLFQSGVRDFYVESEINVDLRDWGNLDSERHYDGIAGPTTYTDLPALFNPSIIKSGNFFKYDTSLSISRLFSSLISWGNMQARDYDPLIADFCFRYYPKRVIYSLPQNLENKKDFWRVYLPNNYVDFLSRVTGIYPINKSGAIILFETASPVMYQGLDQLQTDLGTKLTIGDGGLFSQPQQAIINTDVSLEYGSCQNRLSALNTPFGIFWMCMNQGKIFNYAGAISDITMSGLKYWFKKYLPYVLTQDFPNYPLVDNPVVGIGCQAIYDNQIEKIYFCKKDFMLKSQYKGRVIYRSLVVNANGISTGNDFLLDGQTSYQLGDPFLFENSSWTVSYDPKEKIWLSFHDWHPELLVPSKNNFLSIVTNTQGEGEFWRHNLRVDSFCNFYGIDYPFELDFIASTATSVNTLRSIEYYLECYKFDTNGYNKFHKLDFNFNRSIIYNTEQTSGMLILNNTPKNNPYKSLLYPIIGSTQIDILYEKVEQKYRFNQFWDITADRGEYTTAERYIWLWESNGYKRSLNPNNLNYNKDPLQRKKFRHYITHCVLSKDISGDTKMLVKVLITKDLKSPR